MLNVTSEMGQLRRVVVHAPGREVRLMTPALRHDLLFDDILYVEFAKHEHEAFRQLLSVIVPPGDVLDAADLLRDVLDNEPTRRELIEGVCRLQATIDGQSSADIESLRRDLLEADPAQLATWLIEGRPDPN